MFQVAVDESGTHKSSPTLAVAAYFGRPEDWRRFTASWNAKKKPINVFHAVDCANRENEFDSWSREKRDKFVSRLLPAIPKSNIKGLAFGIVMDDFKSAMRGREDLIRLFGNPYQVCFLWLLQSIVFYAVRADADERFAIVHETNQYQDEALAAFNYIKKNVDWSDSIASLTFAKKDFVPLQAADVLAYEVNKILRKVREPNLRRSFEVIRPSVYSIRFIDKKHMPAVVAELDDLRRQIIDHKLNEIRSRPF